MRKVTVESEKLNSLIKADLSTKTIPVYFPPDLRFEIIFNKVEKDKPIHSYLVLGFVGIKRGQLFKDEDYFVIRLTIRHEKYVIQQQEYEFHLCEDIKLPLYTVDDTLEFEYLPFCSPKTNKKLSFLTSTLAMFYPIVPPIREISKKYPLVSAIRSLQTQNTVDFTGICLKFGTTEIKKSYSVTNYLTKQETPEIFINDTGDGDLADKYEKRHIESMCNYISMEKSMFISNLCKRFISETGLEAAVVYSIPDRKISNIYLGKECLMYIPFEEPSFGPISCIELENGKNYVVISAIYYENGGYDTIFLDPNTDTYSEFFNFSKMKSVASLKNLPVFHPDIFRVMQLTPNMTPGNDEYGRHYIAYIYVSLNFLSSISKFHPTYPFSTTRPEDCKFIYEIEKNGNKIVKTVNSSADAKGKVDTPNIVKYAYYSFSDQSQFPALPANYVLGNSCLRIIADNKLHEANQLIMGEYKNEMFPFIVPRDADTKKILCTYCKSIPFIKSFNSFLRSAIKDLDFEGRPIQDTKVNCRDFFENAIFPGDTGNIVYLIKWAAKNNISGILSLKEGVEFFERRREDIPYSEIIPKSFPENISVRDLVEIVFGLETDFKDFDISEYFESVVTQWATEELKIVRIVAKQITKIFTTSYEDRGETKYCKVPMPLDGLAVLRIHEIDPERKIKNRRDVIKIAFSSEEHRRGIKITHLPALFRMYKKNSANDVLFVCTNGKEEKLRTTLIFEKFYELNQKAQPAKIQITKPNK